jgi:hypothetical protein
MKHKQSTTIASMSNLSTFNLISACRNITNILLQQADNIYDWKTQYMIMNIVLKSKLAIEFDRISLWYSKYYQ